ncbi:hypothetical protein [Brevundimonas sp. TWP2-3-4b2]|uniref:hypothetical protein n=1 Tax=Brevundimonas sp. TWP2-3-4b2 TaxID=2804595 RepID=UPI003CE71CA6
MFKAVIRVCGIGFPAWSLAIVRKPPSPERTRADRRFPGKPTLGHPQKQDAEGQQPEADASGHGGAPVQVRSNDRRHMNHDGQHHHAGHGEQPPSVALERHPSEKQGQSEVGDRVDQKKTAQLDVRSRNRRYKRDQQGRDGQTLGVATLKPRQGQAEQGQQKKTLLKDRDLGTSDSATGSTRLLGPRGCVVVNHGGLACVGGDHISDGLHHDRGQDDRQHDDQDTKA